MTHTLTYGPHGATCSCGRVFSIWAMTHPRRTIEADRFVNLARGNARRHADAANRREQS